MRPTRSFLYLPASNARAIEKARTLACDGVILDLEDAVAPDAKPLAREAALEAVAQGGFGSKMVAIRVNSLTTPWGNDDFEQVSLANVDFVVVPKIDSPAEAEAAVAAAKGKPIWAMIESARAVINVNAIAATPGVAALLAGTADLAKDLKAGVDVERSPFLFSLSAMLIAARAHGLLAIDGIHADIQDLDALAHTSRQGALLGFDGRSIVHPSHIDIANQAYSPSLEAVEEARGLIAAHDAAAREGKGVTTYKGRLVEVLHVQQARDLIAIAESLSQR